MATVSASQRLQLLQAKSQETRQNLESNAKQRADCFPSEDEVNRALEDEAQAEMEMWESQERHEAPLTPTRCR